MSKTIQLTFTAGKITGFALGICVNKYMASIDLGFWYFGMEY